MGGWGRKKKLLADFFLVFDEILLNAGIYTFLEQYKKENNSNTEQLQNTTQKMILFHLHKFFHRSEE